MDHINKFYLISSKKRNSFKPLLTFLLIMLSGLLFVFTSCEKDEFLEDPVNLKFSRDTVLFDTVFTSIGSSTHQFKIYNPKDEDLKISNIHLGKGNNSQFRINVNGLSGTDFNDVTLNAKDSLFIFAEVTVDPNNTDQPMIITDSIVFNTNGRVQDIKLVAWGQDANFIVADQHIQGLPPFNIVAKEGESIVWDSPKPYVIYGHAVVDSTAELTIPEGTDVHFHANSGLWVYKGGSLKVEGTENNPVHFQGDRLEDYYKDIPGQWDRIWINEGSVDNKISHAIIENGFIGIQAETLDAPMGNDLQLDNVIIRNMTGIGLLGRNYSISGYNMEISNTGNYGVALTNGGTYDLKHITVANYWSSSIRQTPSVYLNNYYELSDGTILSNDLNASIENSIIHGNQSNEFHAEDIDDGSLLEYTINHCLVKTEENTSGNKWNNCIINQDPEFEDKGNSDFTLKSSSPAIDNGDPAINIPTDLKGDNRDAQPDIGAYEYIP
ncbi:MAG: choice-of-anchor Q domain-containing protein [Bacteroidota bacterium]